MKILLARSLYLTSLSAVSVGAKFSAHLPKGFFFNADGRW
jgi:hypothetical protein